MNSAEILVVAGEASGDQHAADLVGALQAARPSLRFFGMGGPKLAGRGVELLYSSQEISVMGITEVLPKLPRIFRVLRGLAHAADQRRPALAILVDVPDFNLRLASRLSRLGIPVVYYVSPTIWAWRPGRIRQIARSVTRMLCILPFEEPLYRHAGVGAVYVGSPVLDGVPPPRDAAQFRADLGLAADRPTLALLPGSRRSEIHRLLPGMGRAAALLARTVAGLQVVVPVAPGIPEELVREPLVKEGLQPVLVPGQAAAAVGASDGAIVASGTAALEAGLMERPFVVVYRVSRITYWLGRLLLKVAHVALVNILAGRRLVPELLQGDFTPERVVRELKALWEEPRRTELVQGLREVRRQLGPSGASARAAAQVLEVLDRPPAA